MRVQDMNMKETMEQELAEAIRTLEKANGALARIFNVEEEENEVGEWEERTGLSHAYQVERWGWCVCEGTNGEGQLADDCPREGGN
jgi:hypothetical protein